MTVYDIKNKASDIMISSKDILFKVFVVMGVVSTIFNSVTNAVGGVITTILSLLVLIVFLPFGHGYIVSALKAVNNRSDEITIEEDGFVGFRRFKELFGTYFIYNFFMFILVFIFILISVVAMMLMIPEVAMTDFNSFYTMTGDPMAIFNVAIDVIGPMMSVLLPAIIIVGIIMIMYTLWFGLTPYLLEREGLRGTAAMKRSMQLMKGYKWLVFKVDISFLGWMIVCGIITTVVEMVLPIAVIVNLIGVVVSVFFYESKLQVCHAIVFEEIMLAQNKGQTITE